MSQNGLMGGFVRGFQARAKRKAAHRVGNQGLAHLGRGNLADAERALNGALHLFRDIGDVAAEATTYTHLAAVAQQREERDEAEAHLRSAAALFDRVGDTDGQATVASNLGVIKLGREDWNGAEQEFRAARKLYQAAGNKEGVAHSHGGVGLAHLGRKDYDAAAKALKTSIEGFEAIDQRHGLAPMLVNLAETYYRQGRIEDAVERWDHAAEIYRALGETNAAATIQERIERAEAGEPPDDEDAKTDSGDART
jgi:tetratricopeptide (TPR) repeat protein